MHLGATVQHWLLIVRILLKPKNGREAKAGGAHVEENYCKTIQTSSRAFSGFFVSSKASPECYIQGSCRGSFKIKVLNWKSF